MSNPRSCWNTNPLSHEEPTGIQQPTWLSFGLFVVLGLAIFGRILWIQGAEHEQWNAIGERFESSVNPLLLRADRFTRPTESCLATSVPVFEVRGTAKAKPSIGTPSTASSMTCALG